MSWCYHQSLQYGSYNRVPSTTEFLLVVQYRRKQSFYSRVASTVLHKVDLPVQCFYRIPAKIILSDYKYSCQHGFHSSAVTKVSIKCNNIINATERNKQTQHLSYDGAYPRPKTSLLTVPSSYCRPFNPSSFHLARAKFCTPLLSSLVFLFEQVDC